MNGTERRWFWKDRITTTEYGTENEIKKKGKTNMNNARRKEIKRVESRMDAIYEMFKTCKANTINLPKVREEYEDVEIDVSALLTEEEMAYDNLPESMQNGERGELMEECIDALTELDDWLNDIADKIIELEETADEEDEEWQSRFEALRKELASEQPSLDCCF